MRLQWRNVPVPEGNVVGIVAGALLQRVCPPRFRLPRWIRHWIGWPLILLGAGLALWAAITAGDTELSAPDTLVTRGPYALSRNPMYVGWTLLHAGTGLAANAPWILAFLPAVVAYTHLFEIPGEEKWLEERFGERYQVYRQQVRRYGTDYAGRQHPYYQLGMPVREIQAI